MRCVQCQQNLTPGALFCAACGAAVAPKPDPGAAASDRSITAPGLRPGVWNWILIVLLLAERLLSIKAFPLEDAPAWERHFQTLWGWGLLALAGPLLALRWRPGGWLAFLSGVLLILRSCVPLIGEDPVPWAVVTLMISSATLTFAFLYEQSFWPHLEDPMGVNREDLPETEEKDGR